MVKPSILDPDASYSFSQYDTLPFDTEDVLAEFGVAFQATSLWHYAADAWTIKEDKTSEVLVLAIYRHLKHVFAHLTLSRNGLGGAATVCGVGFRG